MFCNKCGTQIQSTVRFCPVCGALIQQAKPMQQVQTAQQSVAPACPAGYATTHNAPVQPTARQKNKIIIIVSIVLAALVLLSASAIGIWLLTSRPESMEEVAVNYVNAAFDLDYSDMNARMAMPYDKMMEDFVRINEAKVKKYREMDMDDELIEQQEEMLEVLSGNPLEAFFDQCAGLLKESRSYEFGKDYKRSVEMVYERELPESEQKEFLETLKSNFDQYNTYIDDAESKLRISNYFAINKVDAIYEITCEVTEEGAEDFRTTEVEFMILEINGKFKAFDGMFGGGDSVLNYVDMSGIDTSKLDENLKSIFGMY